MCAGAHGQSTIKNPLPEPPSRKAYFLPAAYFCPASRLFCLPSVPPLVTPFFNEVDFLLFPILSLNHFLQSPLLTHLFPGAPASAPVFPLYAPEGHMVSCSSSFITHHSSSFITLLCSSLFFVLHSASFITLLRSPLLFVHHSSSLRSSLLFVHHSASFIISFGSFSSGNFNKPLVQISARFSFDVTYRQIGFVPGLDCGCARFWIC